MPTDNPMKYVFVVEYLDGSTFVQNDKDVSAIDPARSAFFDVAQDQVKTFSLWGDDHAYLVDLRDGHFEVDGVTFKMHEPNEALPPFRLIFFRRHRHQMTAHLQMNSQRTWEQTQREPETHEIVFRMGWQALNARGENIQRVMEIE